MQIMKTVVRILMQAQVLPSKEFDTWEQTAAKTYPDLKTFIHEAYTRRLQSLALCTMTGQQGYTQGSNNMFNMLADEENGEDTDTANNAATVTQTAAYMMESTLGNTYGGAMTIPSEICTAINQLAANQVAVQQQMAAMTFAANSPSPHTQFHIPPIQNMGSNLLRKRPRACSTLGKAEEAASVDNVEEDAQEVMEAGTDTEHSHTKCLENMEAPPHLSMAHHWRLCPQQEQG
jgi:hypothetical protein